VSEHEAKLIVIEVYIFAMMIIMDDENDVQHTIDHEPASACE
jgi:hypothetical protein